MKKQAFTLVELIVVITILAILGTIAFISLQGYARDARDSVRISDMKNMEKGLTLYKLDYGKYPVPSTSTGIFFMGTEVWKQGVFGESVYKKIGKLSKIPEDPLTFKKYTYSTLSNLSEFSLASILESELNSMNNLKGETYALNNSNFKAFVLGNYNGLFTKVSTGGLDYILALPSIITSSTGSNIQNILNNNELVYLNGSNLPTNYNNSGSISTNDGDKELVKAYNYISFKGDINDLKSDIGEQGLFLMNLQNAYSDSYIEKNSKINSLLSIDSSDYSKLNGYVSSVLENSVGKSTVRLDNINLVKPSISYDGFYKTLDDGTRVLNNKGNSGGNDGLLYTGQGLSFNGTNQYISTGNPNYTGNELTYFFTVKLNSNGSSPLVWSEGWRHLTLYLHGLGIAVGDYQVINFDNDLELNKYYRIAIVRDLNNIISVYINGVKQNDTIQQSGEYPMDIFGYKTHDGNEYYFDGIMQNIQFYNKSFTDEQIKFDFYNPERELYLKKDGVLASDNNGVDPNSALLYYPLNEGTGDTVFNVANLNLSDEMFIDTDLDDIDSVYPYYSTSEIDSNVKRKGNNSIKFNFSIGHGHNAFLAGLKIDKHVPELLTLGKTYIISLWIKSTNIYNIDRVQAISTTSRHAFINDNLIKKETVGGWTKYEGTPTYSDNTVTGDLVVYSRPVYQSDNKHDTLWYDGDISVKEVLGMNNIVGYDDNMWLNAKGLNYGLQSSLLKRDDSGRLVGLSDNNVFTFDGKSYINTGWVPENDKAWTVELVQFMNNDGFDLWSGYRDSESEQISIGKSRYGKMYNVIGNKTLISFHSKNELHLNTLTFDGVDKYTLYDNGKLISKANVTLNQTNLEFYYGGRNAGNGNIYNFLEYYGGYFKKYDKELSETEVQNNYKNFEIIYGDIR